jgi:TetR/AcrR family transcriptional regulator
MNTETSISTEEAILMAARKVFELKGFDGARMQEISDRARINRALLHYYFRTKEKMFERIFDEALERFMPLLSTWDQDLEESWEWKLKRFIITFITFLKRIRCYSCCGKLFASPNYWHQKLKSIERDSTNLCSTSID